MTTRDGWVPTETILETSNVARFAAHVGIESFDELLARSLAEPQMHWDDAVSFLGLPFSTPYEAVCDSTDGAAWAKWFVGGRTNVASMCIDRWLPEHSDNIAIRWFGEDGSTEDWTWRTLHEHTEGLVRCLRERGIGAGDRVALFLPMIPEAVVGFLAVARIGAIVVPLFSGFGADAIRVRLEDSATCAVLVAASTLRRGQSVPMAKVALDGAASVASVRTVIVVNRRGEDLPTRDTKVVAWPEPVSTAPTTLALPSDHDLLLAYTSGTTGLPKGAVHTHGGLPIKVAAEGAFQHDLRAGDRLLWFSDMGWIMGPYQIIAALANGATLCMVEGAPDFPTVDRLWAIVEQAAVTVLGLSPTLIRSLISHGDDVVRAHDMDALRILGSTGEAWNLEPWHWYFDVVGKGRCPVINMSGGTEVGGALLSPHPVQRIPPASLVGPSLGMAVDVFDDRGSSVRGEVGELVCTKPWPGMTKGLYRDPERYEQTYWRRWPNVWMQGDWASVDEDGYWYLHGRSDDTIMIAGKRLGPAEPESALVSHPDVIEAAAVGFPDTVKGESLMVFVVLRDGVEPSPDLTAGLSAHVASLLGGSFRPTRVLVVDALPKTRSGKVVRRALRAIVVGDDPGDLSSLEDPAVLERLLVLAHTPSNAD